MTTPVAILLSGRGSNFVALHSAIERGEIPAEIVLVLSNVADAAGLDKARELGLPAVLNIDGATRVLDGCTVTVDGDGGSVVIEDRGHRAEARS